MNYGVHLYIEGNPPNPGIFRRNMFMKLIRNTRKSHSDCLQSNWISMSFLGFVHAFGWMFFILGKIFRYINI